MRCTRALLGDRGSAVVEFALIVPLLIGMTLAVLQVALAMHVRSTLTAAAGEGARAAALAGSDLSVGVLRAKDLIAGNLASEITQDIRAVRVVRDGLLVVEVTIDARLPLLGLLGPASMHVSGHALQERA